MPSRGACVCGPQARQRTTQVRGVEWIMWTIHVHDVACWTVHATCVTAAVLHGNTDITCHF